MSRWWRYTMEKEPPDEIVVQSTATLHRYVKAEVIEPERDDKPLTLFDLEEPDPFSCEHELAVADIGKGKTECGLMGKWTNCREVGHCTAEGAR